MVATAPCLMTRPAPLALAAKGMPVLLPSRPGTRACRLRGHCRSQNPSREHLLDTARRAAEAGAAVS